MRTSLVRAIALSTIALCGHAFAGGATFGKNLAKNPGAEAGEGSASGFTVVTVPRWTQSGNFTAVVYGASGFPGPGDPRPPKPGLNFFSGGPDNESSSATQTISLSALAADIDAGTVKYALSAWLGGFATQEDQATLEADFTDGPGRVLLAVTLGPVTAEDRGGVTALLKRSGKGRVPEGTRKVHLVLTMTRFSGSYNDGYADALSLVLSSAAAGGE